MGISLFSDYVYTILDIVLGKYLREIWIANEGMTLYSDYDSAYEFLDKIKHMKYIAEGHMGYNIANLEIVRLKLEPVIE